jgi:hypothetical protein
VLACRVHRPALPPLPALVVRLVNGRLEYPGQGYFEVTHPGVEDELQRLALWGQDVQDVQRTDYPPEL